MFSEKFANDRRIKAQLPLTQKAVITLPEVWVYAQPSPTSAIDTQFLYNEHILIHPIDEHWAYAQSLEDGYCGYIARTSYRLVERHAPTAHTLTHCITPVFAHPDFKTPPICYLAPATRISPHKRHNDYYHLADLGWILKQHMRTIDPSQSPAHIAATQISRPYVWGGRGVFGLDCSALVQLAFRLCGIALPRDCDLQQDYLLQTAEIIPLKEAKENDLIYTRGHVMIIKNQTDLIHANAFHMQVCQENITSVLKRIENQDKEGYTCQVFRISHHIKERL